MNAAWAFAGLSVALLGGCSAPAACEAGKNPDSSSSASAAPLVTTTTLTSSGESLSQRVRATLGNLPKLWQDDSNIVGGSLSLTLTVVYQGTPRGDDGKTQMPRVLAHLGLTHTDAGVELTTSEFQSGSASGSADLFVTCQSKDQQDCCQYGQPECSLPLLFDVRRLDGAPLPAVDVTATVNADAEVSRCPLPDREQATLELEVESP